MLYSLLCTHEFHLCIHAIGVLEEVTLLEFKETLPVEDQEQPREPEEPASEGVPGDELPKCPDHHPFSFLKGKPRCMLTHLCIHIYLEYFYLFTALSYRSWVKTLVALYLSLSRYRT
jgi:hypothetical protein